MINTRNNYTIMMVILFSFYEAFAETRTLFPARSNLHPTPLQETPNTCAWEQQEYNETIKNKRVKEKERENGH